MIQDITIVLPVYNDQMHIKQAVLSAVSQAEHVIISDNMSTDGTFEICQELAEKFKNIQLFRQEKNIGGVRNFNFLYQKVKSKYVMNMGSHDFLAPNYVYELKTSLDNDPDAIMAYAPAISIDDNGNILDETMLEDFDKSFSSDNPLTRVYAAVVMEYNFAFYGLFRSKYFLKNLDFKQEPGVDHIIMAKCLKDGKFIRSVNTRFYLRIPTRVESEKAYMERLTGKNVEKYDISYTCTGLLDILDSLQGVNQTEREAAYYQARDILFNRYYHVWNNYHRYVFERILHTNKKVILYGAGTDAARILKKIAQNILFFVDKDITKHGMLNNDIPIYSINKVYEYDDVEILISQIGRFVKISNELLSDYKIKRARVISLDEIF